MDAHYREDIAFRLTNVAPTATIETNNPGHLETSGEGSPSTGGGMRHWSLLVLRGLSVLSLNAPVVDGRELAFNLLDGFWSDAAPDRREYCDPTTLFRERDFSESPYFRTEGSGVDMVVPKGWSEVRVRNRHTTRTIAPPGLSFGGGTRSGVFAGRASRAAKAMPSSRT